ncbi:phycocyanobilin:ferredoxin oxidoreductase [Synechococcus sp. PCC 7336]|uniref:phycocyanobilin:ferredoxin oxidoreductase n=1 Tax=Synechococcus sp. PCC 7336 TaxID=195250 RepID=UPI0006867533|nr:phycocyanobilin:ferredoxin oxidoreductase [Synechococcus sp. PCC 7336]
MYATLPPSFLREREPSLRDRQHDLIRKLANCIETVWHRQLTLLPYSVPPGLGYIEGQLEEDRLTIENHCYQTSQFRKLHLELARVGNNLDILHCVMFPRSQYPLPIFGTDIVVGPKGVSAAIVDLSPVTSDLSLPSAYSQALSSLPAVQFSEQRNLPIWGDIFSKFCLFVRPHDACEEAAFLQRVQSYLTLHCTIAVETSPSSSEQQQNEILSGQNHYCTKQRQNDKTRRVLEKSFGVEWTERYLQKMLFDCNS